jgi:hypothetical protein
MSDELREIDDILSSMNISYTGEDIRRRLDEKGYVIVKISQAASLPLCWTKERGVILPERAT